MEKKCYILQQSTSNGETTNIFYNTLDGKPNVVIGQPEQATRFATIGEAMKTSADVHKQTNVYFKAVEYFPKD